MKRTALVLLALLLPLFLFSERDETQDAVEALLESVDLSEWDAWLSENGMEGVALPSEILTSLANLQKPFAADLCARDLVSALKPSFGSLLAGTALFVGLAAFGAALQGISEASPVGETAGAAFRIGVSAVVLVVSMTGIRSAFSAITALEHTAELLLPVIVGYLTLTGLENTALLLPVSHALLNDVVLRLIETCAAPLAITGGVLLTLDVNGIGRLSSVGRLMQRAAKWILTTACSVYLIVTTVRSVAAASADSLLMKTTKLAAGSIPAIGSLLSESVDAAYQCMRLIRNALGLTGCTVLILIAAKPVVSVFLTRCSLRASALLSEPLSGKPYAELLRGMGDTLHILLLCELAALAMSLLMLAPVIGMRG
jgi:stage III sporulation protein AE